MRLKLEERRKAVQMTRRELSDAVGVTESSIFRYERVGRIPDIFVAVRMANALGCTVEDLVSDMDEVPESVAS